MEAAVHAWSLRVGRVATPEPLVQLRLACVPSLARLLGGSWPTALGWTLAFCAVPIMVLVDASYKALRRSHPRETALASVSMTSGGRR